VATLPQLTNACRRRCDSLGPVSADSLCIGDRRAAPACCHHQLSTSLSNVAIYPQVIRGSGPGEVAANVGRLRDSAWELRFDSEETAGYAEALMEQHEAKARAHLCEVCVQPAMMLTQAGIAAVPAGLFGMERGLPRGNYSSGTTAKTSSMPALKCARFRHCVWSPTFGCDAPTTYVQLCPTCC